MALGLVEYERNVEMVRTPEIVEVVEMWECRNVEMWKCKNVQMQQ